MGCCSSSKHKSPTSPKRRGSIGPTDGQAYLQKVDSVPSSTVSGSAWSSRRSLCETPSSRASVHLAGPEHDEVLTILGKYRMSMGKKDIMGEGTSSICRRGTNIDTGEAVAIKVYKSSRKESASSSPSGQDSQYEEVKLQKFQRQIAVLTQLMQPFSDPTAKDCDSSLWHQELATSKPSRLFMQLLDYSKTEAGEPGPDPTDGNLYVVTELGQYTLKDYLTLRRDQQRPLLPDLVRRITKAIVHVVAGLHAKSLVHIDLKPENLMMFSGRLKLIDVDGCMPAGTDVSIQDASISFSPCYCAPEWARFLIEESDAGSKIRVSPCLDVWSCGMTICELVTLDAILKPTYANFLKQVHSHREAGFLFMDWLSSIKTAPLPTAVEKFDEDFADLLSNHLLVTDSTTRRTLAQVLGHPYIANIGKDAARPEQEANREERVPVTKRASAESVTNIACKAKHGPLTPKSCTAPESHEEEEGVPKDLRLRSEDLCAPPLFKGTLWKLDAKGDPKDKTHWVKRDVWMSSTGALCYFSIKENRRFTLIDRAKLVEAQVMRFKEGCFQIAFEVTTRSDKDDGPDDIHIFGCDSEEDYEEWTRQISADREQLRTFHLGKKLQEELRTFKLKVTNRRITVEACEKDKGGFAPIFKAKLWKLQAAGDRMREEDWYERDMWLAKNGSFVYWSPKEERELVHYTRDDVARATLKRVKDGTSWRPWTFQVMLPPSDGVEFCPGEFAADSQEMLEAWFSEFAKWKEQPAPHIAESAQATLVEAEASATKLSNIPIKISPRLSSTSPGDFAAPGVLIN